MNYLDPTDNMWGLDVEGDGYVPTRLWCVCLVNLRTKKRFYFTEAEPFKDWLSADKDRVFIGHNILKADRPWLEKLWRAKLPASRCVDTFVLSQLFDPKLPKPEGCPKTIGTHSLAAYGYRFNDHKIGFTDFSAFSPEMLEYCFQDVLLTLKVYRSLAKKLKALGFSEKSVELEHQIVPIIAKQQENGFEFDREDAERFRDQLRSNQRSLETDILRLFPATSKSCGVYTYRTKRDGTPYASYDRHRQQFSEIIFLDDAHYECFKLETFNIGSPTQRTEKLIAAGYKPTAFTPTGLPKVDEDALVAFAETSGIKEVQMIADWLVLEGRANMIQTWLNSLGTDGRIHGDVFTCGANSRRMRHAKPNTANIPRVNTKYGREVRSLWTARPGRVLVGVDAAALEGRMFYHHLCNYVVDDSIRKFVYSQVVDGKPHKLNAQALTDAGINCGYEDAKTLYYAFLYGAGDAKLGSILKGSSALGRRIRDVLATAVPGLAELLSSVGREYEDSSGLLRTIDGGLVRASSKGGALNYKLQPDGAILMKQALVLADKALRKAKLDYLFVGNIHDEWQIDCEPDHADAVGRICCDSITSAGTLLGFNVPLTGEYKIGNNWAETH